MADGFQIDPLNGWGGSACSHMRETSQSHPHQSTLPQKLTARESSGNMHNNIMVTLSAQSMAKRLPDPIRQKACVCKEILSPISSNK
jgi:hypothetical protein